MLQTLCNCSLAISNTCLTCWHTEQWVLVLEWVDTTRVAQRTPLSKLLSPLSSPPILPGNSPTLTLLRLESCYFSAVIICLFSFEIVERYKIKYELLVYMTSLNFSIYFYERFAFYCLKAWRRILLLVFLLIENPSLCLCMCSY